MVKKFKLKLQYPSEKQIQATILKWLDWKGILSWRNNTGAVVSFYKGRRGFVRYGKVGSGDIFAVFNGRFVSIECKDHKGIVSEDQEKFMKVVNESGGLAFVARNLEDVENKLKENGE
jgi:penicillin-binding protein-related factor A (putative recombinase)